MSKIPLVSPRSPRLYVATVLALALVGCADQDSSRGGDTLYVEPAADGEWDDPVTFSGRSSFTTIQDAVDAASSGDTVEVPSGTYYEDVTMRSGVSVIGAGQNETYLVGSVTFSGLSDASLSRLSLFDATYASTGTAYTETGITVTGGDATIEDVATYYFQYGVHTSAAADVTLDSLRLGGNWYGVYAESTTNLLLSNGFIYSNPAGGVATSGGTGGRIVHNTMIGNGFGGSSAYLTGALSMGSADNEVVANNILISNYYGLNCYSCSSSWNHNLIWGNTTNYVNDASASASDIAVDPRFSDPGEGDYSLSASSPCIDVGNATYGVATDVDGETRPQGAGYDLGMDEYASTSYDLIITEVMANAHVESTGEFVEIYNAGSTTVELAGLILTDGDDIDTLEAFGSSATTLAPGDYAVVVDPEYASEYTIDSGVPLLTTGDTTVGNGLTTSDHVVLYEPNGSTIISTFSHPTDPGDGVSLEMYDLETGDASGNWRASQCATSSSPGAAHCFPETGDPADLVITEVMANAPTEATGEYIEIYNPTTSEIDLAGLVFSDGASTDTLAAYNGGSTLVGPGVYALVLDSGYTYDYYLPTDVVLVTAGATLGNGLSVSDSVYLYDTDGTTLIDSFTTPSDPGDGYSIERIDYALGDTATNWAAATVYCTRGRSPGRLNGAAGGICDPLLITEVMANADDEDTGEFIELYNAGWETIDLAGLVFTDGDEDDTLQAYDSGSTLLAPGGYALIVDAEYAGEYTIDASVVLVTTSDTTLGNALSVSDPVMLYEADGYSLIDAFLYPSNPGNALSIERVAYSGALDSAENWEAASCASGSSPGAANCVSGASAASSTSSYDLVITEVMANAISESTGEFVEIYNNGSTDVDLLYWVVYDGDAVDTILGYSDPFDTILPAGGYAVILDQDYAGDYSTIPSGALLLTTDDHTIGSGLATNDPIYLFESNAVSLVDSFSFPSDPGNGTSIERINVTTGDVSTNWQDSPCSTGSSPGQGSCP